MIEIKPPGKKIRETCVALGKPYEIKIIDFSNIIYRNLGNGYDIEVRGLDNREKTFTANLYVWDISKTKCVETISNIESLIELKDFLGTVAIKYLNIAR